MARLEVLIQTCTDGRVIARVPELWGCHVTAIDRSQALAFLDTEVSDYLDWRKDVGHPVTLGRGKRSLIVAEECHVDSEEDVPGDTPVFEWDRQPVSPPELHEALEVCAARMRQLESLAVDLHPRVLVWESPDLGQSVESVLDMLEGWLAIHLTQLGSGAIKPGAQDPLERLNETLAKLVRILRELDHPGRQGECAMPGYCGQGGETWTIRKLLRRVAEIEADSVRSVRQIIRDYQSTDRV